LRDKLLNIYAYLFGRPGLIKLNRFLFHASLKGMGVLNYQDDKISGEEGFLKQFLQNKTSPVILDVGANIGRYAQMILQFNPGSRLHCFEPHPSTFKKLEAGLKSNSQVHLVNKGAGVEASFLELYDYSDADGTSHASIYKDVIETMHRKESVAVRVEIIDLKSYLESHRIAQVDLLKIDTEGNELNVLKGLGDYLSTGKIKAIHLEFNEMNIASRSTFKDFWEILKDYQLFRLLPNGKMLPIEQYITLECELYAYQNIVAIHSR
jgi:FkbM family methyltransferase